MTDVGAVPVEQLSCQRAQHVGPALLGRPLHDGVLIPQARLGVLDPLHDSVLVPTTSLWVLDSNQLLDGNPTERFGFRAVFVLLPTSSRS